MIDSGVRQMSPCLFNVYIDVVMKEGVRFLEDGRVEITWPLVCS